MSKQNKTQPKKITVTSFLASLSLDEKRQAKELISLFREVSKAKPVMWGESIVGFGQYHYKYESGREGDFLATGFAMRKSGPTIYIMPGYADYSEILKTLGPHKLGKSCLYLKSLEGIHMPTLKKLIRSGLRDLKKTYPTVMK